MVKYAKMANKFPQTFTNRACLINHKRMLNIFQLSVIEELKALIQKIWNSISSSGKIFEK